VLDNIVFVRARNSDHQAKLIVESAAYLEEGSYSLLIIDSMMASLRTEYVGRGELQPRQCALGKMLHSLTVLAEVYKVAIVITNQVLADPGAMFASAGPKPIGGNVMAHSSTTILGLKKTSGETRKCTIMDSPNLQPESATYTITTGGIADA
jgi:RecA/RadA recombinase